MDDDGMGCFYILFLTAYVIYKWVQSVNNQEEAADRTDFPV